MIHGVKVGVFLPEWPAEVLFTKIRAALDLIRQFDASQLARMHQLVSGILVIGNVGPLGAWHQDNRLIKLREDHVGKTDTHPIHIAATLIHETTHAWLHQRGYKYSPVYRRRMEAVCYRRERNFARRVPGCEELADYYESRARRVLAQSDDDWSDAAFQEFNIGYIRQSGVLPDWLMRLIESRGPAGKRSDEAGPEESN